MVRNQALIFKSPPLETPVEGEHFAVETGEFDLETAPPQGCITVKTYYASFDPYQRGLMRDPDSQTWAIPFVRGKPFINGAVAKVLKSNNPGFKPGDVVWGMLATSEYSVVPESHMPTVRPLFNPAGLDWKYFTGILGTAGMSAWVSLYEYGKPKKGETLWVSAASGAVGTLVGQLALLEGLKVVGSVGSQEKLEYIQKLGFVGFNYKETSPAVALKELAPEGIDIYIDNVGGEHLEIAIDNMKDFGRIVSCGAISQYNLEPQNRYGVRNLMEFMLKRLTMSGFIVSDPHLLQKHAEQFGQTMYGYLLQKTVAPPKHDVTIGIENAPKGFLAMFSGANSGKSLLQFDELSTGGAQ
ncbi:putative zinc-type alcohol dehydrogenase-like protein PB24D3.08c [Pseudovirgaria hyperparasitica]|uniref:Putative zinc-type alcohol dehydrogenase-like protein PB24D3.08c n=1 Tax=Pseudovirgaria hyperparasitica TaxID=470096 RepID=A0A6A6WD78_9PEZI|nr:putative zinc-type alcohol dehydrogenase-like protein PB24D3.08c [Pseudovirgaria hyperparasitica]KAF2760778.1 putative zinc-type alcohol dehydrogenase-like protein PB24D3.08c [Pseudovirgaria hyperparasitica]